MKDKLTFLIPAYQGNGMNDGELGPQIATQFPESTIIAVYNGIPEEQLPPLPAPYWSVWSEEGLRSALEVGYLTYVDGGFGPLVRTDSDEHPIEQFGALVEQAVETNGLIVGDLVYDNRQDLMPPESPDGLAQLIWREMYGRATGGRVRVGCAHGLLIFPSTNVCRTIVHYASYITNALDKEFGETVQWGNDGIMILAAVAASVPVTVVPIDGKVSRNRPTAKIADQFKAHLALTSIAQRHYPELAVR